jgi:hypothetical protein
VRDHPRVLLCGNPLFCPLCELDSLQASKVKIIF